jgi:hypothetical protein
MILRKTIFLLPVFLFALAVFYGSENANANLVGIKPNADSALMVHARSYTVSLKDFGKKVFYSWTTPSQIKELRGDDDFLSRSESPTKGKALYDIILSDTAFDKYPMATILRREQFAKKRFAWIDGWATVMGWEGENYGDQLLKITLKDSAIVVAFYPYCDAPDSTFGKHFAYSDANGNRLSEKYVLQHQNQIAAVYFSAIKIGSRTQTEGSYKPKKMDSTEIHYREYIICNEKMIEHWEYGTPSVKKKMNEEINFLNELSTYAKANKINDTYYSYWSNFNCWEEVSLDNSITVAGLYDYTIALPNDFYLLNQKRLPTISATMTNAFSAQGESISH